MFEITVTPSSNNNSTINNTDSSTPEETTESSETSTVNEQMHEQSQQMVKDLTQLTKTILSNPKATEIIGNYIFGKNTPKNSVASFLKDATHDKKKQKILANVLKTYVRNPK